MKYNSTPVCVGQRVFQRGELVESADIARVFGFSGRTYATWIAHDNLHALGAGWLQAAWQKAGEAFAAAVALGSAHKPVDNIEFSVRHAADQGAVRFRIVRALVPGGGLAWVIGAGE